MRFSFLTIFPDLVKSYFRFGVLGRAVSSGIVCVDCIDIRDFSSGGYGKVDGKLAGGTPGMVFVPDVLKRAVDVVQGSRVIFVSPSGALFSSFDSLRLSRYGHISFVCGRYEGFDERSIETDATEVFSIGDFIMTGGELAALSMCDSIARHVDGVLGNSGSLCGESFEGSLLEAPNFTQHNHLSSSGITFFPKDDIPSDYLGGNHGRMRELKAGLSVLKTKYLRPDLYQRYKVYYEK